MWTGSTFMFLFAVAAIKVQLTQEEELCPRQVPPPGVLVLKLGSHVVLGCRGDVTVDDVLLVSPSVVNKKHRNKQREDVSVSVTYQKIDSGLYTKAKHDTAVTDKPPVTLIKEDSTSRRVLRAISQSPEQEEEAFGVTTWTDFDQDDYEDYDYEEERSRVTRGIKKRTRWTLNGRQVRVGVEKGGILRRQNLGWKDAGNYSCYRGERLVSTVRISVGVPPERPTVACYRKFHTSKVRCDWTSKHPVTPRPLCYLLLMKGTGNITREPCSFSSSRCWCAFTANEGAKTYHLAKLCVSNTVGNATSPKLGFTPYGIIKPDPPANVSLRPVEGLKNMLNVSWSYPRTWKTGYYALEFQLRYKPQLAERYQTVTIKDEKMDKHVYFKITDALPHTLYEAQLHAKDEFVGHWSDWTDTAFAVTWSAPRMTPSPSESTTYPSEMFPEGSGGSGEGPDVGSVVVDGDGDDVATVWLYVSCVLCFLVALTIFFVYFLRNRLHFMPQIGKQALPFTFLLHSARPLPDPAPSEALPEEGKSLMSPPKHNPQQCSFQPEEQEGIHLHNMDYFLSPGTEDVEQ